MNRLAAADPLHAAAVAVTVDAAKRAPEGLRSVVFASPLCARSPDGSALWHAGHRTRHRARLLGSLAARTVVETVKGLARLLRNRRHFGYALYGTRGEDLLVVHAICGRVEGRRFVTPYVRSEPDDALFVFGDLRACGPNAAAAPTLTAPTGLAGIIRLSWLGLTAALRAPARPLDRLLMAGEWLRWSLGYTWSQEYQLERMLETVLAPGDVRRVGGAHEMHHHSRVAWRVAARHGVARHTVQHASITEGKFWYFPDPAELAAGLELPDVFHVFSESDRALLTDHYPVTEFRLGCSSRFAPWKGIEPTPPPADGYALVAAAMARFDNDVLVGALRGLVEGSPGEGAPPGPRLRVRLHPHTLIRRRDLKWLERAEARGLLEVSRGTSLADDIAGAALVVGTGTTVLQEALLLGRPVLQIVDPDYVDYLDLGGLPGALRVGRADLTAGHLERARASAVDPAAVRSSLGLDQPEVTWGRLFSTAPRDGATPRRGS